MFKPLHNRNSTNNTKWWTWTGYSELGYKWNACTFITKSSQLKLNTGDNFSTNNTTCFQLIFWSERTYDVVLLILLWKLIECLHSVCVLCFSSERLTGVKNNLSHNLRAVDASCMLRIVSGLYWHKKPLQTLMRKYLKFTCSLYTMWHVAEFVAHSNCSMLHLSQRAMSRHTKAIR